MIELFRSILGGTSRDCAAKKPAQSVGRKPVPAGADYRAVSVLPSLECYAATKDSLANRYLLRDAPRLPLAQCTMPKECTCKFRKHSDRRDGERRLLGVDETSRWFAGSERRVRRARRTIKS